MKSFLTSLVVLCVMLATAAHATLPPTCTTSIPRDSCAFYSNCLEATFPCGPSGYALGYGGKYCQAFSGNASTFSAKGKQWISDVMYCLQTELVPVITTNGTAPTCPEIKTIAFNSHPACYVQAGVCTLPLGDWLALARVIGLQQLIADLESVKQEIVTAAKCSVKWLQLIVGALKTHHRA